MEKVLQVEHISKVFSLGKVGTGSFRQDVMHWINAIRGKKDPFFTDPTHADTNEIFWALRGISFDVYQGEVLGIVGRNGAGKSTLLKILSNVIKPTQGRVYGKGRINSLLEIGTGFHDELSGRENIYLNGYFLGMHRQEIKQKFDEIVAFSGVEKFLDTPVKRYSSGMYVRLAFAVAAHLEPDILIVDEVLAVGDAEFQKKCLGKMHEVSSKQGRTILFVSHNMQAVSNLCTRALLLQKGSIAVMGETDKVVNAYLGGSQNHVQHQQWNTRMEAPGNEFIRVQSVEVIFHRKEAMDAIDIRTPMTVKFRFWNQLKQNLCVGVHLFTQGGECIFDVNSTPADFAEGLIEGQCDIPGNFLNDGSYYFSIIFVKDTSVQLFYMEECLSVEVEDYRENMNWYGKWPGYVRPRFPFRMKQISHQLTD